METDFASRGKINPLQKRFEATVYTRGCGNCSNFFRKTSNIHNKGWTRWDYPPSILSERVDQSHLTMQLFTIELVSNAPAQLFPDNTLSSFTNFFTRTTESARSMGGCNSKNLLPSIVPNCHGGNIPVFRQKTFKFVRLPLSGTWSLHFHSGYCWNHEHSHSRKTQSQRKLYHI